jgi:hypothetical protein
MLESIHGNRTLPSRERCETSKRRKGTVSARRTALSIRHQDSRTLYCYGFEGAAPILVPITSPEMMISTRRFCWRPAGVLLLATGFDFP